MTKTRATSRLQVRSVWSEIRRQNRQNCRRKRHHKSAGAAAAHIRALMEKDGDQELNAYPCPCGAGWLVGHSKYERKENDAMRVEIP